MEVRQSTKMPFSQWTPPNVKEVEIMTQKAADRYGLATVLDIHTLLRTSESTPRSWRKRADKQPEALSNIRYGHWAILVALGTGEFICDEPRMVEIPPELIQTYKDYTPPSLAITKCFVGAASYTGKKREELASLLGIEKGSLTRQMKNMPFYTYALLLMYCGVAIESVFPYEVEEVMELKERPADYVVNYDLGAMERRYLGDNPKHISYDNYLSRHGLTDTPKNRADYVKTIKNFAMLDAAYNQICAMLGVE